MSSAFRFAILSYSHQWSVKANILIDQTGNARLADFGLLTIISDPANHLSSSSLPRVVRPDGWARSSSIHKVWPGEQSPNEIFGLLCSWNGHIRNYQRTFAIPQTCRFDCFREGLAGEHPYSRSRVCRESVEDVGTVLDASAK
jgi:hypothetical protein